MVEAVQMGFNPHPLRGAGATLSLRAIRSASSRFQSSPAPRSGCNETPLKRSELVVHVSILTRSEERVQPVPTRVPLWKNSFQSSPAPRSGCNDRRAYGAGQHQCFNPHPLRGAGATCHRLRCSTMTIVSILTRSEERVQRSRYICFSFWAVFQSSPAPRSGCNRNFNLIGCRSDVSILTRSEERVQPADTVGKLDAEVVSILTRSEERVQPRASRRITAPETFQSSPAPRSGGNFSWRCSEG